jgi:hypothetical protein
MEGLLVYDVETETLLWSSATRVTNAMTGGAELFNKKHFKQIPEVRINVYVAGSTVRSY